MPVSKDKLLKEWESLINPEVTVKEKAVKPKKKVVRKAKVDDTPKRKPGRPKKQRKAMTPEFASEIGKMGGLKTKARKLAENPHYYEEIGYKGGEEMKKRGKEYFSMIGKMSAKKNAKKIAARNRKAAK